MRWDVLFSTLNLTNFAGMLDFASMSHVGGWGEHVGHIGEGLSKRAQRPISGTSTGQLPCPASIMSLYKSAE